MQFVNDELFNYLDAKQHLWNKYFREKILNLYDCEPLESFEKIDKLLFFALVCHPLGLALDEQFIFGKDKLDKLIVKPKPGINKITMSPRRASTDNNIYWEKPRSYEVLGLELSFIEFFQWEKYGFLSCSTVLCEINAFSEGLLYVGQQILVELRFVDFFMLASQP